MTTEFEVEPGEVTFAGYAVWQCRTLNNESHETQVEETASRFAFLLERTLANTEAFR